MSYSYGIGSVLAVVCALAAGCGGSSISDQDALSLTEKVLSAYETGDAKTLCSLSSKEERDGFSAAAKQVETKVAGCVGGAELLFEDSTPLDRAYLGLAPGEVTAVRRDGDAVVVMVKSRTFTRGERRQIKSSNGQNAFEQQLKQRPVRVFREDGHLVASL